LGFEPRHLAEFEEGIREALLGGGAVAPFCGLLDDGPLGMASQLVTNLVADVAEQVLATEYEEGSELESADRVLRKIGVPEVATTAFTKALRAHVEDVREAILGDKPSR
jgi:hypothetical protein